VQSLATASGASWKSGQAGSAITLGECKTVSALLHTFLVGTEQSKIRSHGVPPKPAELKPFGEYEIVNPARHMKWLTNQIITANRQEAGDSANPVSDPEANSYNYLVEMDHSNLAMEISVNALAAAMGVQGSELNNFAGYKLLRYCANLTHGVNEQIRKNAEQAQTHDIKHRLFPTALSWKRQYRTVSCKGNSDNHPSMQPPWSSKKPLEPRAVSRGKKRKHYPCIMFGETCTGCANGSWRQVPPPQPDVEPSDSNETRITLARKRFKRQEWLRRAMWQENCQKEEMCICGKHLPLVPV